ncbi:MAG: hypothetical protein EPN38_09260, partial [Rhodanobacteraceae bacterium]
QRVANAVQAFHEFGQACAFTAKILRVLRVVPDVWILELAAYFFEAFALGGVVKDTPLGFPHVRANPRCVRGWDWSRSLRFCRYRNPQCY